MYRCNTLCCTCIAINWWFCNNSTHMFYKKYIVVSLLRRYVRRVRDHQSQSDVEMWKSVCIHIFYFKILEFYNFILLLTSFSGNQGSGIASGPPFLLERYWNSNLWPYNVILWDKSFSLTFEHIASKLICWPSEFQSCLEPKIGGQPFQSYLSFFSGN